MTRPLAVVSGGAGELGRAIADRFLADGYSVAVLERTEELADSASRRTDTDIGVHLRGFVADQTDRRQIEVAVADAASWGGPPTAVVANAGYAKYSPILTMDAKTWNRHTDVNLSGTFHLCQVAAQHMVEHRRPGSLTIIASSLALAHSDQVGGYCVTKAALLPLMRTFAAELGIYGIRANAVLPGVIETEMTRPMLDKNGTRAGLLDYTPSGRLGNSNDVASAVAYLVSPAASWVTGTELRVDGGQAIYNQPQWLHQDRSVPFEPTWNAGLGAPELSRH